MGTSDIIIQLVITLLGLGLTMCGALCLYRYYLIPKVIVGVKSELSSILSSYVDQKLADLTDTTKDMIVETIETKVPQVAKTFVDRRSGGIEKAANYIVDMLLDGGDVSKSKASPETIELARKKLAALQGQSSDDPISDSVGVPIKEV